MGKYWLLDRHGAEGPSIMVETDGGMRIVDVMKFGPSVTELKDQQEIWDDVAGKLAPTLKPFIAVAKLAEDGCDIHADLKHLGSGQTAAAGRGRGSRSVAGEGRVAGGAKRTGGRGRG